eukprot:m.263318 g.263318  ORF g.263318 m.263318 type:complete len:312 (-) comp26878_c0_seq1:142-1077(-)
MSLLMTLPVSCHDIPCPCTPPPSEEGSDDFSFRCVSPPCLPLSTDTLLLTPPASPDSSRSSVCALDEEFQGVFRSLKETTEQLTPPPSPRSSFLGKIGGDSLFLPLVEAKDLNVMPIPSVDCSATEISSVLDRAHTPPPSTLPSPKHEFDASNVPLPEHLDLGINLDESNVLSLVEDAAILFSTDSFSTSPGKMRPFDRKMTRPSPMTVHGQAVYTANGMLIKPVSQEVLNKRDSHNISERHRRRELKNSFQSLRMNIPAISSNPRVHTGQILKHAIEYIRELREQEAALMAAKECLRATNTKLRAGVTCM